MIQITSAGGRSKVKDFYVTAGFIGRMITIMNEDYPGTILWIIAKIVSDLDLFLLSFISPLLNETSLKTFRFYLKEDADPSQKPNCITSIKKRLTKTDVFNCLRENLRNDFSDDQIKSTFMARRADIMVAHLNGGPTNGQKWFKSFQPDLISWLENLVQQATNCIGQVAQINSLHAFNYVQHVLEFASTKVKSSNIAAATASASANIVPLDNRFSVAQMLLGTKTRAEEIQQDIKLELTLERVKRSRQEDQAVELLEYTTTERPKKKQKRDKKNINNTCTTSLVIKRNTNKFEKILLWILVR